MGIKKKILIPVLLMAFIGTAAMIISSVVIFDRDSENSARQRVDVAMLSLWEQIDHMHKMSQIAALGIAENPEFIEIMTERDKISGEVSAAYRQTVEAVGAEQAPLTHKDGLEKDAHEKIGELVNTLLSTTEVYYCTVADSEGNVVFRKHVADMYSDSISSMMHIQAALGVQLSEKDSAEAVPVIEPRGAKTKLSTSTAVAVYDGINENPIGVVSAGFRIDDDGDTIVNLIKDNTKCEVSFFAKDVRVTTTVEKDGEIIIGGKADNDISDTVLNGNSYIGKTKINGNKAIAKYEPLRGDGGVIVGMAAVSEYTESYEKKTLAFATYLVLTMLIGFMVYGVVSAFVSKGIEENLKTMMEQVSESDELTQTLLSSTPLFTTLWSKDYKIVKSSNEVAKIFGLTNEQEYIDRFFDLSPEFQPNGSLSSEMATELINRGFKEGNISFEWMHKMPGADGKEFLCEITLIRIKHKNEYYLAGYTRDLRKERAELNDRMLNQFMQANTDIGIAMWDVDIANGDIFHPDSKIYCSKEMYALVNEDDSIQNDFTDTVLNFFGGRVHPDEIDILTAVLTAHLQDVTGKARLDLEYRGLTSKGQWRYFHLRGKAFRNENGVPYRLIGAIENVDKNVKLKNELRDALGRTTNILNGLDAMIYVTDPETSEILFINNNMRQHYNIEGNPVGQKCYKVLQTGMDEPCDFCPIKKLEIRPESLIEWEEYNDATDRYYQNYDRYIRWTDNKTAHIQHSVDITDIKKATNELDYQSQYQSLMMYLSRSFLSSDDMDTMINSVLEKIGEFFGFAQILMYSTVEKPEVGDNHPVFCTNEWMDPSFNMPSRIGGQLKRSAPLRDFINKRKVYNDIVIMFSDEEEVRELLAPYRVNFHEYIVVAVHIKESLHSVIDFSLKSGAVLPPNITDMITLFINILTSAFNRQITEKQLITAKEAAEQSNRSKSIFLSNMSHEIRTPINAILGTTEILSQNKSLSSEIEEAINLISDSGNLLINIINDILDFSKIESGKMRISINKYDIPSLINNSAQFILLQYENKPLAFNLLLDKDTPMEMFGDELRIKQVLNNILSNAFKYTDHGEITLSVFTESNSDGSDSANEDADAVTLILRVSDTGQGMTEEQLTRLFDEYTRFNMRTNRTITGAGLGMNITKHLIDMMSGEITVESEPGKGTTFTVKLPQKRGSSEVCGEELSERMKSLHFQNLSKSKRAQIVREHMPYGRVLIVDDVQSNLFVAKGIMRPYGLKIDAVESGVDAIELIKSGRNYDVIFMDHMMPFMDGIEAVKIIRKMGYNAPILALTANAVTGQEEMFLANGFDGFISKPIDLRKLNVWLNKLVRDKHTPEEREAAVKAKKESQEAKNSGEQETASEENHPAAEIAECFIKDAKKAIAALEKIINDGFADLTLYTVTVHGIKSALANVGEGELSEFAKKLELAGQNQDTDTIAAESDDFLGELKMTVEKYKSDDKPEVTEISDDDRKFLRSNLMILKKACEDLDVTAANNAIIELRGKAWTRPVNNALSIIDDFLLQSYFDEAAANAGRLMDREI